MSGTEIRKLVTQLRQDETKGKVFASQDLAAVIRHARRHDPNWDAAVVRNATAAQRQKLLGALVDGFGIEDTLDLLSKATIQLRGEQKRLVARAS